MQRSVQNSLKNSFIASTLGDTGKPTRCLHGFDFPAKSKRPKQHKLLTAIGLSGQYVDYSQNKMHIRPNTYMRRVEFGKKFAQNSYIASIMRAQGNWHRLSQPLFSSGSKMSPACHSLSRVSQARDWVTHDNKTHFISIISSSLPCWWVTRRLCV